MSGCYATMTGRLMLVPHTCPARTAAPFALPTAGRHKIACVILPHPTAGEAPILMKLSMIVASRAVKMDSQLISLQSVTKIVEKSNRVRN